jgi:outer membrane protein assembly factor BamB
VVSYPSRRRVLAACGALAGSVPVCQGLMDGAARTSATSQNTGSSGWPMAQHDPGGTSYAPDASPPKDGVRVRWKQPIKMNAGPPYPSPIVANGLVYGVGQKLVCVTATSGDIMFRSDHNAGTPALAAARAYQSPTLVFPTWDGAIGLNARGGFSVGGIRVGLTRWQTPRRASDAQLDLFYWARGNAPIAADGTVFVIDAGTGSGVLAIDASSGRLRWRSHHGQSRPAVRDGTVYVVGLAETGHVGVFGYDTETGEQTFSFIPPESMARSVTAAPDSLVVGTDRAGLLGVDYDGTLRWRYGPQELQLVYPPAVAVADGVVYGGFMWSHRNWLVAIDAADGTELWRSEISRGGLEPQVGVPAVANDVVYVPTGGDLNESEGLVAVDATDGHIRWRFSLEGPITTISPAALGGETLYVLGITPFRNNHLYALEER